MHTECAIQDIPDTVAVIIDLIISLIALSAYVIDTVKTSIAIIESLLYKLFLKAAWKNTKFCYSCHQCVLTSKWCINSMIFQGEQNKLYYGVLLVYIKFIHVWPTAYEKIYCTVCNSFAVGMCEPILTGYCWPS